MINDYLIAFISYLFGSIPFGLIITKLYGIKDIRTVGSGNIGATNVLRVAGKKLGLLTLILDSLKSAILIIIAKQLGYTNLGLIAICSVLGHIYPVWLKFKGGKGVATTIGALFAVNYKLGLIVISIWLIVFFITNYSSLASIISNILAPFVAYVLNYQQNEIILSIILGLFIIYKHKPNIVRLINKQEPKSYIIKKKNAVKDT